MWQPLENGQTALQISNTLGLASEKSGRNWNSFIELSIFSSLPYPQTRFLSGSVS